MHIIKRDAEREGERGSEREGERGRERGRERALWVAEGGREVELYCIRGPEISQD